MTSADISAPASVSFAVLCSTPSLVTASGITSDSTPSTSSSLDVSSSSVPVDSFDPYIVDVNVEFCCVRFSGFSLSTDVNFYFV